MEGFDNGVKWTAPFCLCFNLLRSESVVLRNLLCIAARLVGVSRRLDLNCVYRYKVCDKYV